MTRLQRRFSIGTRPPHIVDRPREESSKLNVIRPNLASRGLARKLGFRPVGRLAVLERQPEAAEK